MGGLPPTVQHLLEEEGFRARAPRKELITGHVDPQRRNRQFEIITDLKADFQNRGCPVLSVDTKALQNNKLPNF